MEEHIMGNVTLSFSPRKSLKEFTESHSKISLIRRIGGAKDSDNKIIHGENLAALAALKAGAGVAGDKVEVDIIYIDPPYNVGGDQGYKNKWKGKSEKERHWAADHGQFLDFMEPRLKIGRSLLKSDGVIFISICDGEYCRLKILMDQIFGEDNCLGTIIWNKGQGAYGEHLTAIHEYILVYAKNKKLASRLVKEKESAGMMIDFAMKLKDDKIEHTIAQKEFRNKIKEWLKDDLITKTEAMYNYLHPKTFIPFQATSLGAQDKPDRRYKKPLKHPLTGKNCKLPNKNWKHCKETLDTMSSYTKVYEAEGFVVAGGIKYGSDEKTIPRQAFPLTEGLFHVLPTMISVPHNQGKKDLPKGISFTTPKPLSLIKQLVKSYNKKDAVVLDYFGGSGATGHAVSELNDEDSGSRKWIMIEEMGSTFNLVMKPRLEQTITDKSFSVYELKNATVADEDLMAVFGEYSKDYISAYHQLDDSFIQEKQAMSVVGYDHAQKQIVGIINPDLRSGKRYFEQELKVLKDQIKKSKARKCLIYTINDGSLNSEEPWIGLDKSILSDTTCKSLRVVEIPEQLVKEWTEVLTAMAA